MANLNNEIFEDNGELYFFANFETETIDYAIKKLVKLIRKNKASKKRTVLNIKSYGGAVYEGYALIDLIREHDVHVHVMGYAMSMGFITFCAARTRSMSKTAVLMDHGIAGRSSGKIKDLEIRMKEIKTLDSLATRFIKDSGFYTEKEMRNRRDGWEEFFYYDEVEKKGVLNTHPNKKEDKISSIELNEI